MWFCGL
jgi:hypothetical protein